MSFITDNKLKVLSQMPFVHTMDLACCDITDDGLANLKPLKLETLDLDYCDKITNAGLYHLRSHPLRNLCLSGCMKITDVGLSFLADMSFECLDLTQTNITDSGLANINSHKLKSLGLGKLITDASLDLIMKMPLLQQLSLVEGGAITEAGVDRLLSLGTITLAACIDLPIFGNDDP